MTSAVRSISTLARDLVLIVFLVAAFCAFAWRLLPDAFPPPEGGAGSADVVAILSASILAAMTAATLLGEGRQHMARAWGSLIDLLRSTRARFTFRLAPRDRGVWRRPHRQEEAAAVAVVLRVRSAWSRLGRLLAGLRRRASGFALTTLSHARSLARQAQDGVARLVHAGGLRRGEGPVRRERLTH